MTGFNGLDSLAAGRYFCKSNSIHGFNCTDSDSVIVKVTGVNDAPLIASNLHPQIPFVLWRQTTLSLVTSAFTLQDDDDQMDSAKISIYIITFPQRIP